MKAYISSILAFETRFLTDLPLQRQSHLRKEIASDGGFKLALFIMSL
jgi:hypothetical protein